MTDLHTALTAICTDFEAVARHQATDRDPSHEDFYDWGWALTELLDRVDAVAEVLERQIPRYDDRRILRDDEGADPHQRLVEMASHLSEVRGPLSLARERIRVYHSAASHIGVAVDPDAEAES